VTPVSVPAAGPDAGDPAALRRALKLPPQPLYLHPARLLLIWSPKCACTQVVLWFFKQCGLLEAAEFYHRWPHQFRVDVLRKSQGYKAWVEAADPTEVTAVQFGRSPIGRALSSYRHVLKWGLADQHMTQVLGRRIDHREGFRLTTLLSYLEALDHLEQVDTHLRPQARYASRVTAPEIVLVDREDLYAVLNRIERTHGLPETDFAAHPAFARVESDRRVQPGDRDRWTPETVLCRRHAWESWPAAAARLDASTRARIARIYADDMNLLGLAAEQPAAADSESAVSR
jgi:hypothetical protein